MEFKLNIKLTCYKHEYFSHISSKNKRYWKSTLTFKRPSHDMMWQWPSPVMSAPFFFCLFVFVVFFFSTLSSPQHEGRSQSWHCHKIASLNSVSFEYKTRSHSTCLRSQKLDREREIEWKLMHSNLTSHWNYSSNIFSSRQIS